MMAKSSFKFFHNILQKNPNKLFGNLIPFLFVVMMTVNQERVNPTQ